jgi:hypothetical protein
MATFRIVHTATDAGDTVSGANKLSSSEIFTMMVPQRFTVSGDVTSSTGSALATPANPVYVYLRLNGHTRTFVKISSGSSFNFTKVMPGNYTIKVHKSKTTFGPEVPVVVDADKTGINIASIP